jgi:hypothetical protein
MILTQLETVETELQRKRYGENKILELSGLKGRSRGHPECLKRIKDRKDMANTRFRGFSVKKQGSRGLLQETRDLNIIMHINRRSIAQKIKSRISGGISKKVKGLNNKNRASL